MIEQLFSSQISFAILAALFKAEARALSTLEIIALTGKNQANIKRELDKLIAGEFVLISKRNKQNYYLINQDNHFYKSLKNVFGDYHKKQRQYFLFNEESATCVLSVDYILRAYISDYGVKHGIIREAWDSIAVYKGDYGQFYFDKETIEKGANESLKKLVKDPSFVFKIIYPESLARGEEALAIFKQLFSDNFKISKSEAIDLFDRFLEIISVQVGLNTIAVFDLKDQIYSNYLKKYLTAKSAKRGLNLSYVMEQLLAPEKLTYTQLLRLELLHLAVKQLGQRKISKSELKKLHDKWSWLNYGYIGPGLSLDYFKETLKELQLKSPLELKKEISNLQNNEALVKKIRKELYGQLAIDASHQKFIEALSLLSYLKIYRKDTAFLIFFCIYQIFEKLLPQYPKKNLFNITIEESKDLLCGRLKVSSKELMERSNYCAYAYGDRKFFYGSEVDKYLQEKVAKEESSHDGNLKLLEGTASCLGKTGDWVYGEVKIINSASDMSKMREGDILVSVATTPDILPAMKKAAAIVTDHGGITCHAAIVSRELNIPCLIATKYATKVFKDGDKVLVCPRHNYIKFQ